MKLVYKIAMGVSAVIAAGVVVAYLAKRSKRTRKLYQIAEEGYETAEDILFPGEIIQDSRLRYGPVIPN